MNDSPQSGSRFLGDDEEAEALLRLNSQPLPSAPPEPQEKRERPTDREKEPHV